MDFYLAVANHGQQGRYQSSFRLYLLLVVVVLPSPSRWLIT
jgi:hypothetical protein